MSDMGGRGKFPVKLFDKQRRKCDTTNKNTKVRVEYYLFVAVLLY